MVDLLVFYLHLEKCYVQKIHKHQWQGQQEYQHHRHKCTESCGGSAGSASGRAGGSVGGAVSFIACIASIFAIFSASFKIFSFNSFIYFFLPLQAASTRIGFFVTFCDILSIFVLRYKHGSHPIFDSTREKLKRAMEQLQKPPMVGLGSRITKRGYICRRENICIQLVSMDDNVK